MKMMPEARDHSSQGFALAAAMLIVLLLAGISAGTMYLVNTESRLGATDLESTQAFYGAEAAMEKMMVDLNFLYAATLAPSVTDIEALGGSSFYPLISGITYPNYTFTIPNVGGEPITEVRPISSGPNEGLTAYIVPLTLGVTASGPTGVEVRMEREIQMALIPVFQFGLFSETDLSYFPGPGFDFAGRVHTNGNLFLCTSADVGLTFHSKITAVGDIIRAELANGLSTAPNRQDPVWIPTAPAGCDGALPACRDFQENEGSLVAGLGSADTADWADISLTTYAGFIINGDTGATAMDLPFVAPGLRAIELIRRPPAGEDPTSLIGSSRLYNMAQIRVLISDTAAQHPGSAGVRLANVAPYYTGGDYGATDTAFAEGNEADHPAFVRPPGVAMGDSWSLVDGFLLVQAKQADGTYDDVTEEWLDLGIARENPDAILKFEQLRDDDGDGNPDYGDSGLDDVDRVLQLGLYDTREGEVRDDTGNTNTDCAIGGIMNVVELDVLNLRRWLKEYPFPDVEPFGGTTGTDVDSAPQNGYVFYFSDRRGMLPNPGGDIVGEYGFEDMINPPVADGTPDGFFHLAEDVNQNGTLETYGAANLGDGFGEPNGDPTIRIDCNAEGRMNRVSGARHALKLVNASLGNLPTKPDDTGGFTVASENIVYVLGNYNADDAGFGDPHASAAVIADTVSFLSQDWLDWRSFRFPISRNDRPATTSFYRVAVAGGKNLNFPHPSSWASPTTEQDWGLDGGTHNFLRYLEAWGGETFNYRGSLVSLYYSEYGVGIYKCCERVYSPPARAYEFDEDFLDIDKLPPGTPRFRDVVNLGMRQILTPD